MDLADDPFLDAVDELRRGNFGGAAINKPGVGQPLKSSAPFEIYPAILHIPSSGHCWTSVLIANR